MHGMGGCTVYTSLLGTAIREGALNVPTCKPANASVCCIIPRRGRSEVEASMRKRRIWGIGES